MSAVPVETSRDRRRQAIIDVARRIFLENGYGATSMSSIAAAVGGSKGTLYAYFRSKTELFSAVVQDISGQFGETEFSLAVQGSDLRRDLTAIGARLMTFIRRPEAMAMQRLVIGEAERFPELGQAFYDAGPRRKLAALARAFETLMEQGRLRRGDPTLAAEHFFALCQARGHHRVLWNVGPAPDAKHLRAEIEISVQAFCDAYAPNLAPLPVAERQGCEAQAKPRGLRTV